MPQEGPPGQTLGMGEPQAMVAGLVPAQRGEHTHAPPEQVWPLGQRVPVPAQLSPEQRLAMGVPQVTVEAAGQNDAQTHIPPEQVCPAAQRVPVPGQVAPGHTLGMGEPQSTALAAGHAGTHSQVLLALHR